MSEYEKAISYLLEKAQREHNEQDSRTVKNRRKEGVYNYER